MPLPREAADTAVEVALAGDLDMAATFRIEPEVDRLLAQRGVRRLVLSLADVRFIDSAGIGAVLAMRERADRLGVHMTLANVPDPVQRVLDLAAGGTARRWRSSSGATSGA